VYRFLLRPRWLGLAALVLLLCAAFVRLGFWQLDRLDERRARNAVITTNLHRPVAGVDTVLSSQPAVTAQQWRPVRATGTYDEAHTLLLRNQTHDGMKGVHVLVPLMTGTGPALLVDRGWVQSGVSATARVDVPPPPAGEVTVTGRVRLSQHATAEQARVTTDTAQPTVGRLDLSSLGRAFPYPLYGGYVELVREQPSAASAPVAVAAPEVSDGPHLIYAIQWFMFCGIAVIGLVILARQERRELDPHPVGAEPRQPARSG
jgi:cytochrome oxidase assembly protein ShyY1